jgi:putative membrane protein
MRFPLIALAVTAVVASPAAFAQQSASPAPMQSGASSAAVPGQNLTASDFVKQAAIGGMFEVQSSQLAEQKSKNNEIKKFAQHMTQDHKKADQKLASLVHGTMATGSVAAGSKNKSDSTSAGHGSTMASAGSAAVRMPKGLDAKHEQMLKQLKGASGAQFDQLYAQMQLQAHQDAVALFESYSQNGTDPELKTFAQQTLPTLQQHLDMAQKLPYY